MNAYQWFFGRWICRLLAVEEAKLNFMVVVFIVCFVIQLTTVKNPFVSSGDGPTNTTEADVIRLVFSDDTGNAVTPGRPTNFNIKHIPYIQKGSISTNFRHFR